MCPLQCLNAPDAEAPGCGPCVLCREEEEAVERGAVPAGMEWYPRTLISSYWISNVSPMMFGMLMTNWVPAVGIRDWSVYKL